MQLFKGVCTALSTPFTKDGINTPVLERLLERQWEAGVGAVVLLGTTGEPSTMSYDEKIHTVQVAADILRGTDVILIAGAGSNSTREASLLARACEDAGADALLVVTPYYNKATQVGVIRHYTQICDATDLPVIAYNVPSRTGLKLTGDTVLALSKIKGISGIKEASGDIALAEDIILKTNGNLPLYSGCDELTVPLLSIGSAGVISVASNLFPKAVKKMVDSFFEGDILTAAKMQVEMKPLINMLFSAVNPIPVKTALEMMGYSMGGLRLPLCELDKCEREYVEKVLNEYIDKYKEV